MLKHFILIFLSFSLSLSLRSQTVLCTDTQSITLSTIASNDMNFEQWLVVNVLSAEAESDRWMEEVYQNDSLHPFVSAQKTSIKNPNQEAYLVSPLFIPNINTAIRFEYSICLENQSDLANLQSGNVFELRVLTDCESETIIWEAEAKNEVLILDLSQWESESIRVAFFVANDEFENNIPLDVFVDNVFIGETPITDLGFVYPQPFFDRPCLPTGVPFEIAIANYGTDDVLLSDDGYDVSGMNATTPFTDFDETTIAVDDTVLLFLDETTTLDPLLFSVELSSNNDLSFNNFFSKMFQTLPTITSPFLFNFDENSNADFILNFETDFLGFYGNDLDGENGLSINLANISNQRVVTAPIFIESNTSLIFDLSITNYFSQNPSWFDSGENLQILISTDCGYTQEVLMTYDATINSFETDSLSLADYIGQTIVLEFLGDADKDVFLDNLHFAPVFNNDLDLTAVNSPFVYKNCFGNDEKLSVEIFNSGLNLAMIAADVQLSGSILFPDTTLDFFTDNLLGVELNAGENSLYEILSGYDFSQYGQYEINLFIDWALDENSVNDTLQTIYLFHQAPDYDLTFSLTFENYDGENIAEIAPKWSEAEGFLNEGFIPNYEETNSHWIADFFGNDPSHINGTAASINLWENNKKSWLIGPRFEVVDSTQLVFDLALTQFVNTNEAILGSDDTLAIMVSTDCGATFDFLEIYDVNSVISSTGQTDTISLIDYSGQETTIAFYASEGEIEDQEDVLIFIDNIQVIGLFIPPGDVGVSDIISPMAEFCETEQLSLVIRNQNFTNRLQGDFITTAILTGAIDTILHDTIINPLDALGGRFSIFQLQNVYGDSLHITVFTKLEGDTNPLNDTLQMTSIINSPPNINLEVDSVGCDSLLIVPLLEGPVTQFDWSTGDTTQNLIVFEEGEYILRSSYKGCFVRDTINVSLLPPLLTDFSWSLEDSSLFLTDLTENTDTLFWQINDITFNSNTLPDPYVLPDTGIYQISLTTFSENCGSDTLTQIIEYSIEEIEDTINGLIFLDTEYVSLYPNPANDQLIIHFDISNNYLKRIHLIDVLGRKLNTIETSNTYLTLATKYLPAGMYCLIIEENGKYHKSIFIIHHP